MGQTAGRAVCPQTVGWSNLALPWVLRASVPLGLGLFAMQGGCMLLPQTLVPRRKMGMKVFHRMGGRNAMISFSHKGSGSLPTAEILCCTSLLTAHQNYPNSYPVSPVQINYSQNNTFFLHLLMRSLEFCNLCNFFGVVLQINNLF